MLTSSLPYFICLYFKPSPALLSALISLQLAGCLDFALVLFLLPCYESPPSPPQVCHLYTLAHHLLFSSVTLTILLLLQSILSVWLCRAVSPWLGQPSYTSWSEGRPRQMIGVSLWVGWTSHYWDADPLNRLSLQLALHSPMLRAQMPQSTNSHLHTSRNTYTIMWLYGDTCLPAHRKKHADTPTPICSVLTYFVGLKKKLITITKC